MAVFFFGTIQNKQSSTSRWPDGIGPSEGCPQSPPRGRFGVIVDGRGPRGNRRQNPDARPVDASDDDSEKTTDSLCGENVCLPRARGQDSGRDDCTDFGRIRNPSEPELTGGCR